MAQGFVSGLLSGAALGNNLVNTYRSSEEQQRQDAVRKQNEEIAAAMKSGFETGEGSGYGFRKIEAPQTDANGEPAAAGLTPQYKDERTDEERYLDGYRFAQRKAMEIGRPDAALKAFDATMVLRHRLRDDQFTKADTRFRQTGDWNAYVPFFNRYINDGTQIEKIETVNTGGKDYYRMVGTGGDGKPLPDQLMTADELRTQASYVLDPAGQRAAEAAERKRIFDMNAKIAETRAGRPEKDQLVEIEPNKSYYVRDPKDGALKPLSKGFRLEKVKDADGGERLVAVGNDGSQQEVVGGSAGGDAPSGLTDRERKGTWKDANAALENDVRVATANIPDANQAQVLGAARALVGNLIIANRDNENGSGADPGVLSRVAAGIASGQLKPQQVKVGDETLEAVVLPDGTAIYTDPRSVRKATGRAQQRSAALASTPGLAPQQEPTVRGRGAPPAPTPAPPGAVPQERFPRVSSSEQRARDGDRLSVLEQEKAEIMAQPDSPQKFANLQMINGEIARTKKSIGPSLADAKR